MGYSWRWVSRYMNMGHSKLLWPFTPASLRQNYFLIMHDKIAAASSRGKSGSNIMSGITPLLKKTCEHRSKQDNTNSTWLADWSDSSSRLTICKWQVRICECWNEAFHLTHILTDILCLLFCAFSSRITVICEREGMNLKHLRHVFVCALQLTAVAKPRRPGDFCFHF